MSRTDIPVAHKKMISAFHMKHWPCQLQEMWIPTYTCFSRGRDGSTLSPSRGGVSPTRRSVAASHADDAEPIFLVNLVWSGWARERSLSAPSNWTAATQTGFIHSPKWIKNVFVLLSPSLPARALEMSSFFHSHGWSYSSAGLSSSWGSRLSLLSIGPSLPSVFCASGAARWGWRLFSS